MEPQVDEFQDVFWFFILIKFIYLLLTVQHLRCCVEFSLVLASKGYSWLQCMGFPFVITSRCRAQVPEYVWASVVAAQELSSCSSHNLECRSVVAIQGPSFSVICGIYPDRESNLCLLHWQADWLPLSHQGAWIVSF